jgi:hypothetical protein
MVLPEEAKTSRTARLTCAPSTRTPARGLGPTRNSRKFSEKRGLVVHLEEWGGKRESNPQPPEPQSGALPVELFPPQPEDYNNSARAQFPAQRYRRMICRSNTSADAASNPRIIFRAVRKRPCFSGGTDDAIASSTSNPIQISCGEDGPPQEAMLAGEQRAYRRPMPT